MKILKAILKYLMAVFYVAAGAGHFFKPGMYVEIVPPYIPYPMVMVLISGAAEALLGVLVLFRKTQRLAAWGIIALLVAVFPANLHMALHPEAFSDIPLWGLYGRLPFQVLFILWAYWYSRPEHKPDRP